MNAVVECGFDAVFGNPPWASYAGRATQPLEPRTKGYYATCYASFAGYRNLQGMFVERAARLLRRHGRLGLLIPSSMSEQQGYGPTPVAHDALCDCDAALPDIGNGAFIGVFQPCMVLRSTRRSVDRNIEESWAAVRVLIRQTARVPTAVLSDGVAFRNSILAGFESVDYPASFLVAYINSTPIRWLHYMRHRDARQGMPQMKIGHLRSIPAPPSRDLVPTVVELGAALSERNAGIGAAERVLIDSVVAEMFGLTPDERVLIERWRGEER